MQISRLITWRWLKALCLLAVLFTAGCDDDWYHHHHDDDDDYPYYLVTAEMTVVVRDYDTGLPVPNAEVRFYVDHGFSYSLDMYDTYVLAYTDTFGVASTTAEVYLSHPNQCIGIRAVADFSNWIPDSTGTVRFWYPGGGTYITTLYLDDPGNLSASADTLEVPSSQHETIQSAIDVAQVGDRILVDDGVYNENIDFRGKNITVESKNGALATVINGNAGSPTVRFSTGESPYAMLKGFTVRGGEPGVHIGDAKPSLMDNVVESGMEGTPEKRVLPDKTKVRPKLVDVGRAAMLPTPAAENVVEPIRQSMLWLLILLVAVVGTVLTRYWYQRRKSAVRQN